MCSPPPAATSRGRRPSKPRSALWLNAARTSACWRSSLCERTGCVAVAEVISLSIKHLIDISCADALGAMLATRRRWPMFKQSRLAGMLPAQDLERAQAFYRDKLGVTPTQDMGGLVLYQQAGGTGFLLYATGRQASRAHPPLRFRG